MDDLIYDIGNLCAYDTHPIDMEQYKANSMEYLKQTATENMQLLINKIFQLPTEHTEDGLFASLPAPTTILPREKPVCFIKN